MTLVVPDNGEGTCLANFINKTAPEDQHLKLYKSNTTPAETDTTATYTESTFTGYASAAITGATATVTEGAPSTATWAQKTFTSSANQAAENAYGYFVTGDTSGKIKWAERFTGAPYVIQNLNDAIQITPTLGMD